MQEPQFPKGMSLQQVEESIAKTRIGNEPNDFCQFSVDYDDGKGPQTIGAREIIRRFMIPGLISSQPWAPMQRRWGLHALSEDQLEKENNKSAKVVVKTIQQQKLFD